MTPTVVSALVTADMRAQYEREGYFVLDRVLRDDQLELLRGGAEYAMQKVDAAATAAGTDRVGINIRGRRYFSAMTHRDHPELRQFLFSDTMAEICRATLGPDVYFFLEQYVIKAGDPDTAFAWHQDSGYVHENHKPYLTCWIPLDDVTEENGAVYLLPYSRSGIRSYVKHTFVPGGQDRVCYCGSDPGIPMTARAGSIVCFSSVVIHRSGPNRTDKLRRVFLAQYCSEIIRQSDGSPPSREYERFLDSGNVVARP